MQCVVLNICWTFREDLSKLPYLTRCIKEGMRLHSPVPLVSRHLTQPLDIDGVVLEPGTLIQINMYQVHHNKQVWGDDHMVRFNRSNVLLDM